MQKIAKNHLTSQELFVQFLLDPDSKYSGLLYDGHLVNAPKFKPGFNRSDFFDLSQDPVVLNYDAFEKKWSWFKNCTFDVNIVKHPDSDLRPGNPHNIAQIFICLVLQQGLSAFIDDGNLKIRHVDTPENPHGLPQPLRLVPKKKPASQPKVRHDRPPKDVLKYFSYLNDKHQFTKVLKVMYKQSEYRPLSSLKHWRGKKDHNARVYLLGLDNLVDKTGVPERTVKRARALMIRESIIHHRGAGVQHTGYAIHELPHKMSLVYLWKWEKKTGKDRQTLFYG